MSHHHRWTFSLRLIISIRLNISKISTLTFLELIEIRTRFLRIHSNSLSSWKYVNIQNQIKYNFHLFFFKKKDLRLKSHFY